MNKILQRKSSHTQMQFAEKEKLMNTINLQNGYRQTINADEK
jgi:hypothetical protein